MTDCTHLGTIAAVSPAADGCVDCLATGDKWFHLRLCMTCGHVGCCDTSKNKHASAHARATEHPIIQSFEPREDWFWCFVDEVAYEAEELQSMGYPNARPHSWETG